MNFWNTILVGFKEIWAHKFRSLLTMLGIILGVSSLVAMSALVAGMEKGLREALIAMGGLEKVRVEQQEELPIYQRHLTDQATGVTLRDVHALKNGASLITDVSPTIEVFGYRDRTALTHKDKMMRPFVFAGVWPNALKMNEHRIEHGRMFNSVDDEDARSVCVIGTGIRDQLFGDPDQMGQEIIPVGETININNQPFTIIGMFRHYESEEARRTRLAAAAAPPPASNNLPASIRNRTWGWGRMKGGHFVFRMKNNTVYIPLNTMLMKFKAAMGTNASPDQRLTSVDIKVPDVSQLLPALQQARNVLMVTHKGIEDFGFRTQEEEAEQITTAIQNYRMSGSVIAAISLIVGGIGIMNIMLASISERVREIGIRKAVGATTGAVFIQILIESIVIALVGGLAGLFVSYGLVQSISAFTPTDNAPIVTVGAMTFAFTCSACTGIAAGLFPALKASRLHPIQALRYD
jgi:putative ABC transport system permease protein